MKLSNSKNSKDKPKDPNAKKGTINFSIGKKKTPELIDPETFVFAPTLPKVNVIPASVTEKYEIKGVLRKLFFVIVGIVALLGLVWAGGTWYVNTLNGQLETIKAEEAEVSNQVVALTPYEEYIRAVEAKRTGLSDAVSTDVNMSNVYKDLYDTANNNRLALSNISIAQSDGEGGEGACINPDPFATVNATIIGCIVMEGKGGNPEGSKFFVNELALLKTEEKPRYVTPFISSISTSEEGESTFNATISFTDALYTNQYADLKLTIADLLLENTPTEEETVTDEPAVEEEPVTEEPVTEVSEEDETNNTVTYSSAVTTQAAQLVPTLTDEDLQAIDETAVVACTVEDSTEQLNTIAGILGERLPDEVDTVNATMATLTATLVTECEGE